MDKKEQSFWHCRTTKSAKTKTSSVVASELLSWQNTY